MNIENLNTLLLCVLAILTLSEYSFPLCFPDQVPPPTADIPNGLIIIEHLEMP